MDFLALALAHLHQRPPANSPHVCLSFAQSLDAKIAGINGQQLQLSCPESMLMTHHIRSLHDAILVGISTAINDDPQLNTRLLSSSAPSPIPIVLDSTLRLSPNAKLLQNYAANTGRQPWIICSPQLLDRAPWQHRRDTLCRAGAFIIELTPSQSMLSLPEVLLKLRHLGINSLMVEGGARIIDSFLRAALVHTLVITVAPTLVGADGIAYSTPIANPLFQHVDTQVVGTDAVIILKPT